MPLHRQQSRRRRQRPPGGLPSLLAAAALLLPAITTEAFAPAATRTVEGWLRRMTLEEKIGQMNYVPIGKILVDPETNPTLDRVKLREELQRLPAGLMANTIFDGGIKGGKSGWTAAEWRALIGGIQEEAHALGMPPVLYALDHVHGANYVLNATIFPQQINLAATFNVELARDVGRITAKDTKAAGASQVFAPVLDLQQQPLWSRAYETLGEDPYLTAKLGRALVEGIQGPDPRFPDLPPAAATMKHFIGYGNVRTGHDRAPIDVTDRALRNLYLPAFREAVRAGAKACMSAYTEIDGNPMVSNALYTKTLLRHELNWQGLLKPDYQELNRLEEWHHVVNSTREAARLALADSSIDQFTSKAETPGEMLSLVKDGLIPESRIDESVRRILQTKQWLGLLDDPLRANVFATPGLLESIGSEEDKAASLAVARESIVLLKNGPPQGGVNGSSRHEGEPVLPLKRGMRLLVTGQGCDSLGHQLGGWSIHWQGAEDWEFAYGTTIYGALSEALGPGSLTLLVDAQQEDDDQDGDGEPDAAPEGWEERGFAGPSQHRRRPPRRLGKSSGGGSGFRERLVAAARSEAVDAVVACVGEHPYAEKPGDIDSLGLDEEEIDVVRELKAVTGKPLVVVLVEGRTRLLRGLPEAADAVVHAMLPGPFGGQAVAEVLLGKTNPSGRLPVTYPKRSGTALHAYYGKVSEKCTSPTDGFEIIDCPVEWPFGHGLSYTTFSYSTPALSAATINERQTLTVRVTVTNTGRVPGKDALLLFITDVARRVTPEAKLLRRFAKSPVLAPGESWTYETVVRPEEDLSYWGLAEGEDPLKSREILEAGLFYIAAGPEPDCRSPDPARRAGCVPFELALTEDYDPACAAACRLWWRAVNGTVDGCPTVGTAAGQEAAVSSMGAVARAVFGEQAAATAAGGEEAKALGACAARYCGAGARRAREGEGSVGAQRAWDWWYVTCLEREVYGGRACGMAAACQGLDLGRSPHHERHWLSLAGAAGRADSSGGRNATSAARGGEGGNKAPKAPRPARQPEQASLQAQESQGEPAQLSAAAVALAFAGGMAAATVALVMAYVVRWGLSSVGVGPDRGAGLGGSSSGGSVGGGHQRSSSVIRV